MRKTLSILMVFIVVLAIALYGCGKEGSTDKEVELLMYSWRPEDKEAYEKFIAEFEKDNPKIKVTFKPFKSTEYGTILTNALTAGKGPDIIQLRPYEGATSIIESDYIIPLDDVKGINDIPDIYLEAAKGTDGKVYGVPLSLNSALIFYNKDVFEEHNLEVPTTWDQLFEVGKALKEKDIVPIAQAGKASYLLSLTHSVIGATTYDGNEYVADLLAGKADLNDPRFVESVQRMKDLEELFPKDFIALEDKDAQALFYANKAAMYINGSYRLETFESNNPGMNIGILPSFANEEGGATPSVTWVDGSYGVVKASEHQKEAKKFMEFLASKKFGQMFSDELERISAVPGVEPKHALVQEMTKLAETNSTPYLMLVHLGGGTPTTKTTFENALQGMYINKLTVEQVLDESQQSMDKWFEPTK